VSAMLFLIPLAIALGGMFAVLFLRAAKQGQFDDLDEEGRRILEE